jgi:protein-disulfide isomerase
MNRRVLLLAGLVAVAVVVALVAALLGHRSSKSPVKALAPVTTTATPTPKGGATTTATRTNPISGPQVVTALFKGIPQHGDTLGDPAAPVSLLVFEDPQCPFCDEWNLDTLPTMLQQFVRTGKIKLVYRGVEIIGPNSIVGLRAVVGAGLQNKLWEMSDALYANQGKENSGWITSPLILQLAKDLNLNTKKLIAGANSVAVTKLLEADVKQAAALKLSGTPGFVILNPPAVPKQLNVTSLEPAGFIASLNAAIG